MRRMIIIAGTALTCALAALLVVAALMGNTVEAAALDTAPGLQHALRTRQNQQNTAAPARAARTNNLTYHNGPTMRTTSTTYAIFWVPTGSYVSSTYESLIQRYFGDVGGSGLYNNNTQYSDTTGHIINSSTLGGSYVDTSAYPSGTLTDAQVQQEVSKAMTAKGWTASITHLFFVFTAKGENICLNSSTCSFTYFCAYHSHFGSNTLYAAMPYTGTNLAACGVSTSPNGDIDADSTINVTSHEHMEAVTDPLGSAWYDSRGNEIGDKCAWIFGTLNAAGGDVTWNGHNYIVQKEWDNKISGCTLTGP